MAKDRPKDGRPPRRRGKGGTGPGPGYRPNPNTGGKKHNTGGCMLAKAVGAVILAYIAATAAATFVQIWSAA